MIDDVSVVYIIGDIEYEDVEDEVIIEDVPNEPTPVVGE